MLQDAVGAFQWSALQQHGLAMWLPVCLCFLLFKALIQRLQLSWEAQQCKHNSAGATRKLHPCGGQKPEVLMVFALNLS